MASPLSDTLLELPQDVVRASPGLAFDIGSSVAKIVYRSNKEYKDGIPIENEGDPETSRVHLAMFPRENTDDVVAFIDKNCDFTRDEEGVAHISATGFGGSQFKSKMEEKLRIKIKVLPEFDCFIKTFKTLSKTLSKERLLHPISDKAKAAGEQMQNLSKEFIEKTKEFMEARVRDDDGDEVRDESLFPCMIVMAGSGIALMMVHKDGSYSIEDIVYVGGRSFLGMVAATTGERDFNKMMEQASMSDGRTATTFTSDMRPHVDQDEDSYTMTGEHDVPVFPMAKVYTQDKDDVKDGDIIQSLYLLLSMLHAQIVHLHCLLNKAKTAYFCGNFMDNEVARTNIATINMGRNAMVTPDKRVDFEFLRHGGMYGALGAFFDSSESSSSDVATARATATEDTHL